MQLARSKYRLPLPPLHAQTGRFVRFRGAPYNTRIMRYSFLREVRAWAAILGIVSRYLAYRMGWAKRPAFKNNIFDVFIVVGRLQRWPKRVRVRGGEHSPKAGPAVFCSNHSLTDDPFIGEAAIIVASNDGIHVDHMMRKGFFTSAGRGKLYDLDELLVMLGAHHIDRDNVTLSQLRVFVDLLKADESFLMYPTGTRSRSGMVLEYRAGEEEPGGAAFFAAQAQRARPDVPVPITPMARTYNPVTRVSQFQFGPARYLQTGARKAEQRALDFAIVEDIASLVVLHAPHVVGGLLYLTALHRREPRWTLEELDHAVADVLARRPHAHIDDPGPREVRRQTAKFVALCEKQGLLRRESGAICIEPEAVLATPELGVSYRKVHLIKWTANQVQHLPEVVNALEDVALARPPRSA